jgi:hypothetical protein
MAVNVLVKSADRNKRWRDKNKPRIAILNAARHQTFRSDFESGRRERAKEKRCSLCRTIKLAENFYLSNTNNDGLHGWCKPCSDKKTTENGRKRTLGITPEQYQKMFDSQGGACAICSTLEPTAGKKSFCIDHNHQTNRVRGLLCTRCNTMLGNSLDSIDILRKAITYLEKFK